ncbi:MAG: ribonuclease HII [Flavobacteriaceae bacterium]|nr:ribonuclease HII [Flavobacteriaceae bacterium]
MLINSYSKLVECGTDEAGRGSIAGPVTAAAVILPRDFINVELNDSKKLSINKRLELREIILKKALAYSIVHIQTNTIEKINILNASILAMNKSIDQLSIKPEFILVDGNRFNSKNNIPFKCIVNGDSKYMNIAAASILAKTSRDELMEKISFKFPNYKWEKNKGYPTKEHREALLKYGITVHHRKSFKLL